jgi:hypothetical protein
MIIGIIGQVSYVNLNRLVLVLHLAMESCVQNKPHNSAGTWQYIRNLQ